MVIPCIDLMDGKIVQLVKGEQKALELDSPDEALEMFKDFPLLHIIDLDAAKNRGNNHDLIKYLLEKSTARVGGGVRTVEDAKHMLELGAAQVIIGTAAFLPQGVNHGFMDNLARSVNADRIVIAVDCKEERVAIKGWQETVALTVEEAIEHLHPYCSGFLCTCVDREGMMQGTDLDLFLALKTTLSAIGSHSLTAAGGISSMSEVETLLRANIDVALGMAIYTGQLPLSELLRCTK